MADSNLRLVSLTVLGGALDGRRHNPEEVVTEILVGSDPDCHLVVDLPGVSPIHARVWADLDQSVVYDTHAPRGLYVNATRVEGQAPIGEGDVLWLGPPQEPDSVCVQCHFAPWVEVLPAGRLAEGAAEPAARAASSDDDPFFLGDAPGGGFVPPPKPAPAVEEPAGRGGGAGDRRGAGSGPASSGGADAGGPRRRDDRRRLGDRGSSARRAGDRPPAPPVAPAGRNAPAPQPAASAPADEFFVAEEPLAEAADEAVFVEAEPLPAEPLRRSRRRSSSCPRSSRSRSDPGAGAAAPPDGGRPATATRSAGDVSCRRFPSSPRCRPSRAPPRPIAEPAPAPRRADARRARARGRAPSRRPRVARPRPARRDRRPSRRPGPSARPARRPSRGTARLGPPGRPRGGGAASCSAALVLAALRLLGGGVRLDGVEPARLRVGQRATLTGSGFASDPAGNSVLFDDREAKVLQASPTRLEVEVPEAVAESGAERRVGVVVEEGPPRVERGGGGGLPGAAAPRHLARGRPARARRSSSPAPGWGPGATVRFGEAPAQLNEVQATRIRAIVPEGAGVPGTPAPVVVTVGGVESNPAPFIVGHLPVVSAVSPASAAPGDVVEVSGRGFQADPLRERRARGRRAGPGRSPPPGTR